MNAVLISIRPKWCKLIFAGKKTYEIRKTFPAIDAPFKVYVYCTHGEEAWLAGVIGEREPYKMNGTVCAEFVCDDITAMCPPFRGKEEGTCLTAKQMYEYAAGKDVYGWHVTELKVYEKPKLVSDFTYRWCCDKVKKPPQSWMYVNELKEHKPALTYADEDTAYGCLQPAT